MALVLLLSEDADKSSASNFNSEESHKPPTLHPGVPTIIDSPTRTTTNKILEQDLYVQDRADCHHKRGDASSSKCFVASVAKIHINVFSSYIVHVAMTIQSLD